MQLQEPPFPCDYCEESFDLRTDLKAHWKMHSDGNPHICPMCGKSFPDRMSYLKHSELHDQVKPFKCPVCQKSFCYGSDLRKHAITHTGQYETNLPVFFRLIITIRIVFSLFYYYSQESDHSYVPFAVIHSRGVRA